MSAQKYVPEIDGLRAIAVLAVVLFHAGFAHLDGGYVGVDVFFVISGYLITRLIVDEVAATGRFSFANFYYRRLRRLFPALLLTLFLASVAATALFTPQHLRRFGGELVYAVFSLSNMYFWQEAGYFNTASEFKPLLHTWSLAVEEQFYLIWPITLVLLLKWLPRRGAVAAIAIGGVLSLLANIVFVGGTLPWLAKLGPLVSSSWFKDGSETLVYLAPFRGFEFAAPLLAKLGPLVASWFKDGSATIFYLTPFRGFEFAIGALLVWLPRVPATRNAVNEVLMAAGLGLIAYGVLRFDATTTFPSTNALVPCLGAALAIYACSARWSGLVLRNRVMVQIGLISYSVYLVHWPLLVFFKYQQVVPLSTLQKLVLVAASLVGGWLVTRTIEQPIRRAPVPQGGRAPFALVCSLLAMALVLPAASMWGSDGFKWRIDEVPSTIAEQLTNTTQFQVEGYGGYGYPAQGWISGGESGVADIVVIGDSHARHYAAGLDRAIGRPDFRNIYISSASCLMLPGMTRITPGINWDVGCPGALNAALDVLKKSPNATVILAHSWKFQIDLGATLPEKKELRAMAPAEREATLTAKLDALKSIVGNRALVIVGNVPGAGAGDPAGCFSRPSFVRSNCILNLNRQESELPTLQIDHMLESYASLRSGVQFLDAKQVFCKEGKCSSWGDKGIYYSDQYHLSQLGSQLFVGHFKEDLMGTLPRRSPAPCSTKPLRPICV